MMQRIRSANGDPSETVRRTKTISRRSGLLAVLASVLAIPGAKPLSAQMRKIELSDFAKIVSVSDPQISPDGKTIVFVVSRANLEKDRSDRQLVSIDIATGAQHILTYERMGVGSPRWSPSGDRIAFVATEGAGKDAKRAF